MLGNRPRRARCGGHFDLGRAAGPEAAKQRVAIDLKILPRRTFVLTLQSGALKRDSGRITTVDQVLSMSGRTVMRDGG
jgi:hypothetical protein